MSEVEKVVNDLVVVGASAGGVEALSTLVSTLPLDFPAPIVLAQHLDPSRSSSLNLILQRRTNLHVEVITSSCHMKAGTIYVVPANRSVSIKDHYAEVFEDHMKRPRPSVDTLLSTAADAYGDRLIAVILTGSGSDGAIGAVDVKNAGGTVIVQDPQTARYPSMPLALPPTVVDFEVAIEKIGQLLYDLLTGSSASQEGERTEDVLREILEQVSRQTSVDFRTYKASTILRRVGRRMAATHCRTMRIYADYLKLYPEEVEELVKAFLINVTQFFRDADAFAYLKDEILPKVIEKAREHDKTLRMWTAGCATGEEPYSLAMLVTDLLGSELSGWSVKIFATDLDEAAINFARRGVYSENMLKGIPIGYQNRFFERVDHGYRISKALRQTVIFGQQDLSRSAPFPRIDLVLCRNVLIYFTPELQEYVLNQFAFSLGPGGYLFLGKAETVRPIQSFYELVNKHWKVYRCTGNVLLAARQQTLTENLRSRTEGGAVNRLNRAGGKQGADQERPSPALEFGQLKHFNELLLRFLPVGVVVIDRSYHILTANGAARRLLGLRDVANEQDFLHAVRGIPYQETRSAIDVVFRERNALTMPEVELVVTAGGSGRFVSLSIALMQLDPNAADLAAISVTDVTEQVQIRRQLESVQVEQTQLMNELGAANKRLSDVNKELMDANEELQVANEELVLTHEELQASIEELETTNEELQATNEELETNNEELQATNEELEATNDELRARTNELQEITSILESERVRLSEMVELAPFYILVLRGQNLLVEAYNPRYARLLEERVVQGRQLEEVIDLLWEDASVGMSLVRLARQVYRQEIAQTIPRMLGALPGMREVKESYFTYTIVPSHNAAGNVDGVMIYAVDESEQKVYEIEEKLEQFKLILENIFSAILGLYDAKTAALIIGSPRYLEMLSPDQTAQHSWYELNMIAVGEKVAQLWRQVLEDKKAIRIPEVYYQSKQDGTETVWDYTLTPIMDTEEQDTVRFILISAIEITEQVHSRRRLEHLDSLSSNSLSFVSSGLRSPLARMLDDAQMLKHSLEEQALKMDDTQLREASVHQELLLLDKIMQHINSMNQLTRGTSEE